MTQKKVIIIVSPEVIIVGTIDDIGQKVKGKAQQAKGELQMRTGQKGGLASKVKGKINEEIADLKLDTRRIRRSRSANKRIDEY